MHSQAQTLQVQLDCIVEQLQSFVLYGCCRLGIHHHLSGQSLQLIFYSSDFRLSIIMEQTSIELTFEDQEEFELDLYDSAQLARVSSMARESFCELHAACEKQLDFQSNLHLEMQVEQVRDLIFQSNLEITDFIVEHARDNHRSGKVYQGEQIKEQNVNEQDDWHNSLNATLQSFKKTLTLREVQLTMVLFVTEHHKSANFKDLYQKNYGMLLDYIIPLQYTSRPINTFILEDLFRKEAEYLQIYRKEIANLNSQNSLKNREEIDLIINKMKISHSKIKTIGEIFPWACIKDKNDLFSESPCSHRWQKLTATGQITYVALADKQTLSASLEEVKHNLTIVNAAMSVLDRHKSIEKQPLTKRMVQVLNTAGQVLKVALFKSQAHHEASVMMAEPEEGLAKEIWNLPESKKFRSFIELSLPSISFTEELYLPRKMKQYFDIHFYEKKQIQFPMMHIDNLIAYREELAAKQPYDKTIRIRINSPFKLSLRSEQFKQDEKIKQKTIFSPLTKFFQTQKKVPKAVIFHIHGGGFISMSSFIHQTYTRLWACNLDTPIISVDYGKAPDRPFPLGLYDCFQAYIWTLMIFKQIYDVQLQKIIFVGDSAGGNLCVALTTMLLQWKLPPPKGLVLVYPALNLNFNDYTPSLLTALNDMILPHTFLKLCLKAYLKNTIFSPSTNPLISPIVTPEENLSLFPKTQILVGNKDPFHDDCCRFVQQLNNAKENNAKLTIFQQFPHGFLQFDLRLFPSPYAREATKIVENALKSMLVS